MNKDRRSRLTAICDTLRELQDDLTCVLDEETCALDALPTPLADGVRGLEMQENIDLLTDAQSQLEELISQLETFAQ